MGEGKEAAETPQSVNVHAMRTESNTWESMTLIPRCRSKAQLTACSVEVSFLLGFRTFSGIVGLSRPPRCTGTPAVGRSRTFPTPRIDTSDPLGDPRIWDFEVFHIFRRKGEIETRSSGNGVQILQALRSRSMLPTLRFGPRRLAYNLATPTRDRDIGIGEKERITSFPRFFLSQVLRLQLLVSCLVASYTYRFTTIHDQPIQMFHPRRPYSSSNP